MKLRNTRMLAVTTTLISSFAIVGCAGGAVGGVTGLASTALGIQQGTNAFVHKSQVPPGETMEIDGVWIVSTINKRVELDRGRMIAIDPWKFMFTSDVTPDMALVRDIKQMAPGRYQGYDLGWKTPITFVRNSSGAYDVSIQTFPVPLSYKLLPTNQSASAPQSPYSGPSAGSPSSPGSGDGNLDDCDLVDIDPDTGSLICIE